METYIQLLHFHRTGEHPLQFHNTALSRRPTKNEHFSQDKKLNTTIAKRLRNFHITLGSWWVVTFKLRINIVLHIWIFFPTPIFHCCTAKFSVQFFISINSRKCQENAESWLSLIVYIQKTQLIWSYFSPMAGQKSPTPDTPKSASKFSIRKFSIDIVCFII